MNTWTPESQHFDEALSIVLGLKSDTHWSIAQCQVCALRSDTFHAFQGITHEQQRALEVKLKTHHHRRRHQCFIPQMESMLTEAESYVQHLSMAIFLSKILVISVGTAHSQIAPTTNKPQSSNTADMQQSTNVHLCSPRHPNPSRGTAWHTHRTIHIDVLRHQTTNCHTRENTRKPTENGESGGGRWGRTEIIGTNLYVFCIL